MSPPGLEGDALDKHTLAWCERVNNSGGAYLTPATLDGRWMVRVSIGSLATERRHVEALWDLMQQEAKRENRFSSISSGFIVRATIRSPLLRKVPHR